MITKTKIEAFDHLAANSVAIFKELAESAKRSNDALSPLQVAIVNEVLRDAYAFLGQAYRPTRLLVTFSEDTCVSARDARFVLAPYIEALDRFQKSNSYEMPYEKSRFWKTEGNITVCFVHVSKKR